MTPLYNVLDSDISLSRFRNHYEQYLFASGRRHFLLYRLDGVAHTGSTSLVRRLYLGSIYYLCYL